MPRELVQIQVGQCGNQLGTRLLDLYLHEHLNALMTSNKNNTSAAQSKSIVSGNRSSTIDPSALESLQTVFQLYSPQSHYNNSSSNRLSNFNSFQNIDDVKQAMCARTVAVDMEEGVLKAMMSGPLAPYLRSCHRISDVSGAGNNWAVGHMEYGDRHGETIVESVRKTVEACDSIQAFMLMHSLSGGTGSGLGTRILGLLEEEFPDVARFAMVVLPSISSPSDVVVAPYNTCFALRELVEHADCILPLDNDALAKAVDKASGADRVRGGHEATSSSSSNRYNSNNNTDYNAANPTQTGKLPFDDMNAVAAQMFSNLTCGVRFPGQLNLDISDIVTNMVPFPRLQFLVPSISPLSAKHRFSGTNPGRVVDQMFSSVLDTDHTLVECNYQAGTTLCSAFVCRGSDVDVGDVSRNIPRIKERMRRIWWNENGVKTAVCSQPPVGFTRSMMALQNNTAMGERIDASRSSFVKLYTAKSHVHHFREYLEPAYFDDTMAILGDVVTQYRALNENWNNNNNQQQQFSSATSSSVYGNGTNGGTSSLRDMLRERQRQQQMQSF